MGAQSFFEVQAGDSSEEAFREAVSEAAYENGHGGYTGTIAEKYEYILIECPVGVTPFTHAEHLIDDDSSPVSDKWGPAGCIDMKDGTYLFFGSASS